MVWKLTKEAQKVWNTSNLKLSWRLGKTWEEELPLAGLQRLFSGSRKPLRAPCVLATEMTPESNHWQTSPPQHLSPLTCYLLFGHTFFIFPKWGGGKKKSDIPPHCHRLALLTQAFRKPVHTSETGFPNSPAIGVNRCSKNAAGPNAAPKSLKIMQLQQQFKSTTHRQ